MTVDKLCTSPSNNTITVKVTNQIRGFMIPYSKFNRIQSTRKIEKKRSFFNFYLYSTAVMLNCDLGIQYFITVSSISMVTKLQRLGSFLEFQVKLFAAIFIVHTDGNERATTTNKRPRKQKDTSGDGRHFGVRARQSSLHICAVNTMT